MKYIVLIGDGMADMPMKELDGRTPLEVADKPFMNYIASKGKVGMVSTVPDGMVPESDTANLAILGYDPKIYSHGRSPLEATSMGIIMNDDETAIRVNTVAISDNGEKYADKVMLDHSSSEIPTSESRILIEDIEKKFGNDTVKFYPGVSYRHCAIWKNCPDFNDFSRPHDIIGKKIGDYLPYKDTSKPIKELMEESFDFLNNHPLNLDRVKRGLLKANSLWFWGPGKKPSLPKFYDKTKLNGSVICAVDLIKGIGLLAGMKVPFIEGATGAFDTNYSGKCDAAFEALRNGSDLVYIHIEAPDECGHRGETENKIASIELIDKLILGPLMKKLDAENEDYRILLTPDHPTPIYARTHTLAPVPFVVYSKSNETESGVAVYDEKEARKTGLYIDKGNELMDYFLA